MVNFYEQVTAVHKQLKLGQTPATLYDVLMSMEPLHKEILVPTKSWRSTKPGYIPAKPYEPKRDSAELAFVVMTGSASNQDVIAQGKRRQVNERSIQIALTQFDSDAMRHADARRSNSSRAMSLVKTAALLGIGYKLVKAVFESYEDSETLRVIETLRAPDQQIYERSYKIEGQWP